MGAKAEEIFKALAAPQRRQILHLVRDQPMSVGEIADGCGASQQAASHHLQILKDAGLLDVKQNGRRRLYCVNPDGFEAVSAFVAELWPGALDRLRCAIEETES